MFPLPLYVLRWILFVLIKINRKRFSGFLSPSLYLSFRFRFVSIEEVLLLETTDNYFCTVTSIWFFALVNVYILATSIEAHTLQETSVPFHIQKQTTTRLSLRILLFLFLFLLVSLCKYAFGQCLFCIYEKCKYLLFGFCIGFHSLIVCVCLWMCFIIIFIIKCNCFRLLLC